MVVQHNLQAMNANRMLSISAAKLSSSSEKLSSGYRINRAADDAAGLSISEKMRKQIRGLTQGSTNAEDGISSVQTAEGALQEVTDMLQRMNELCVQAANGTNSATDRQYIQDEIDQLVSEVDRVAETTKFNDIYLLKGDSANGTTNQYTANYKVSLAINNVSNSVTYANALDTRVKYTGNNNLYIVDDGIFDGSDTDTFSATKISTGDDITEFMIKDESSDGVRENSSSASFNCNYVAFVSVELDSTVGDSTGTYTVTSSDGSTISYYGCDLYTNGTDGTVRSWGNHYVYNQTTGAIVHLSNGDDMSAYLKSDNTMQDGYMLVDVLYGLDSTDSSYSTTTSTTTSVYETSGRVAYSILDGKDFVWDDTQIADIYETQKLYDRDGNEVTAMALDDYFDDKGNYLGGLFTTSQARILDQVMSDESYHVNNVYYPKISDFVSLTSTRVANELEFQLQVGADSDDPNQIDVSITSLTAAGLGVDKLHSSLIGIVDDTGANATEAINVIAAAIQKISTQRSALGAIQNRLEHTVKNLDNIVENTTASESQIRDTDMAKEMVSYSNTNILTQAGTSMLSQANQANQGILSILQ